MMGSNTVTGVTRNTRHHFSPWFKNRLGWLPDEAVTIGRRRAVCTGYIVTTVGVSGSTGRWPCGFFGMVCAGTGLACDRILPKALPSPMEPMWLGASTTGSKVSLLDLVTPGSSANDASLPLGDRVYGSGFGRQHHALVPGRGRSGAVARPSRHVPHLGAPAMSWRRGGREGALFFAGNTGLPTNPPPETYVPQGLRGVVQVAAGDQHVLALRADGSVVGWGDDGNGQATVPSGLPPRRRGPRRRGCQRDHHARGCPPSVGTLHGWVDYTAG
jgi:hypothetical protein